MIEIAVRINQLVSSNINSLVGSTTNPGKIVKLLIVEIEEAILTLSREASQAERRARDLRLEADRHTKAKADWNEKARFSMSKDREDLARGALAERENSAAAAIAAKNVADQIDSDIEGVRSTITALEVRLLEARQRLTQSEAPSVRSPALANHSGSSSTYSDRVMDRIATITRRADFVDAAMPQPRAASLDEEIAMIAREAKLDSEMETLRKSMKMKKTN